MFQLITVAPTYKYIAIHLRGRISFADAAPEPRTNDWLYFWLANLLVMDSYFRSPVVTGVDTNVEKALI
jgi:hypothetical protein